MNSDPPEDQYWFYISNKNQCTKQEQKQKQAGSVEKEKKKEKEC